jgi:multidrug efflux pump subunit AcrA (membrane-fusion protein)
MKSLKQQLRRFRNTIIVLLVVIAILLFSVLNSGTNQQKTLPDQVIAKVEKQDVLRLVSTEGKLKGIDERSVYFPAQSKVFEIKVGYDRVSKDQALAEVKSTNGIRETKTTIYAPISGIITTINYKVDDEIVNPGTPAFIIVNDSAYEVEVGVNENDITDVVNGQKARMVFPALSLDDTYIGDVKQVATTPLVNTVGGVSYRVLIKPNNLPAKFKLGMSVDVEVITAEANDVLAIPESFLIEDGEKFTVKKIVWKNDAKTEYDFIETEVSIGLRSEEYVEIKSGLNANEEIVEPSFTRERRASFFGS